ncbi:hypothetical protein DY000_02063072 [Brassica cretica]|uniref:Uncharacterized protein n=1 Tax=Brassica cretica TaxID=69181 RepID=A0ABQ7ASR9_BRACR|nr:hypothetical protein DY000_02063072 [Brassica cretica]
MASPSQYFPTPFQSGSAKAISLRKPLAAISFLKVQTANTEESRCHNNCKTDCARARRVLSGGAASESDALKEEVLATGLLEDNLLAS